jgi:hypothetical protein
LAKAKQANVCKSTNTTSTKPLERLFIDISSIKSISYGGSKFWNLIVDDKTDYCWSIFTPRKSDSPEKLLFLFKKLNDMSPANQVQRVEYVRCDNAGENQLLQRLCIEHQMNIQFEYTPPKSPQYNGKVERKYATLYARVRAMLNTAGFDGEMRAGLWAEAAQMATCIENQLVTANKPTPANTIFQSNASSKGIRLHQFGEMAVVALREKITSKLANRGQACIYVGVASDHSNDVLRFFNPRTSKIILSRDVKWLNVLYKQWKNMDMAVAPPPTATYDSDDEDDEIELEFWKPKVDIVPVENNEGGTVEVGNAIEVVDVDLADPETPITNATIKWLREMRRLDGFFNPEVQEILHGPGRVLDDQANIMMDKRSVWPDCAFVAMDYDKLKPTEYKDKFTAPTTYDQAWNHPCPWQRAKWRDGIRDEIGKMNRQHVWKEMKKQDLPSGRQCIKYKWIFDIKRDGRFRARLVACGYSQVPGVDFQESYSPVISDVVFRILIVCQILWRLSAVVLDVEVAFLNGDLEETIYMECPQGVEDHQDKIVLLEKSMYGLVQAARQFFKKFCSILKRIGFKQSYADPCLFVKKTATSVVMMAIHVDDCYIIGTPADIKVVIADIEKSGLKVKVEYNTKDYLSCEILFNESKTMAWVGQPHLVKRLETTFGELVKGLQMYKTPGTPSMGIVRPMADEPTIDEEKQKIYRSAVGTLLQFVKYSRPDIANQVRELAKCMDKANEHAFKEMKRLIKFVLDTKHYGLKLKPDGSFKGKWNLKVYTDSDWAGDKNNRRSVSGFVIFVKGVPVLWKSKLQKCVSLSSSEAEYYALSEAAKEIKFIVQILNSIGIEVETPIIVHVDNVGAIFMSENVSATQRTKHVDARYHYVREFIEEGFLKIIFVRTDENKSDMFTKNVSQAVYDKHVQDYIMDKDEIE